LDLFVREDSVTIIELNPFHTGAGAGLFSWKDHRELFMNGPFEFRIVESPPENAKESIPIQWQKFIDQHFHRNDDDDDDEDDFEEELIEQDGNRGNIERRRLRKQVVHWWPWTVTAVVVGVIIVYKRYGQRWTIVMPNIAHSFSSLSSQISRSSLVITIRKAAMNWKWPWTNADRINL